jgi:type IV fimbrial biogenesis protein FimT
MKRFDKQRGITIVEIMVTLAVAAVLIGLALPAFNGLMAQRALRSQANDLILAVQLARSEATRRGENVSVQAVDASDDTNEWGPGWCVVRLNPGNCPNNANELRRFAALGANTLDGADDVETLTFNARGLLVTGGDEDDRILDLCDPDDEIDPGRRITINLIGRVDSNDRDCHP